MSVEAELPLAAQVASRGTNLVFLAPPSPAWAVPVLAGVGSRLRDEATPGPVLGLAPLESLEEWTRVARVALGDRGGRVASGSVPGRITRLLHAGHADLVLLTPELAFELVRRSVLKLDQVRGLLLLNPERFGSGDDLLAALLQDLPREIQRIVVTADQGATAPLIERYCWRAPVEEATGLAGLPVAEVRVAEVGWRRRAEALADLLEQLDPETAAVWVADSADVAEVGGVLQSAGIRAPVTALLPEPSTMVFAWDLPTPGRLAELAGLGEVVLLAPPGSEAYLERLASRRRPIPLRGVISQALASQAETRRAVAARVAAGVSAEASLAIAPLLEQFDASAVAGALYDLWKAAPAPAVERAPVSGPSATLWIGVGRKDGVSPNDLVGALAKEGGLARDAIGKVEIRETYALVEVRGGDPAAVSERLTGKMIKKRRLVVRPDQKREKRGGSRGER